MEIMNRTASEANPTQETGRVQYICSLETMDIAESNI